MNVLAISFERNAFIEGDPARRRFARYGAVFEELHLIVYAKRSLGLSEVQIADNVWLYPTNSLHKALYIADAMRIARRLRREGRVFDIVSGQDLAETGLAAWRIARLFDTPLHLQDHAGVFDAAFQRESMGNWLRTQFARFLLPKADGIRAVLDSGREQIISRYPALSAKVEVLPVYTDTDRLSTAAPEFSVRERYPQFSSIILMASRFVPQKNIPLALRAFREFLRVDSKAGLVLVGSGREERRLRSMVSGLGMEGRVVFVPWEKDLISYYKGADLFLLSSRYESYGRTLVEAAACGLPFVASDVGVASMLVASGARGIVCTTRDPKEYAAAIAAHLNDPTPHLPGAGLGAVQALIGGSEEEYVARYKDMLAACMRQTV